MKKIYLIVLLNLASINFFAQDSTIAFFNKNVFSGGVSADLIIPLKRVYGITYNFNTSLLINIDYSITIANKKDYALGFDLNAELGLRTLEYLFNDGPYYKSNVPTNYHVYEIRKTSDVSLSIGINYNRKLSSESFIFYNLDFVLGIYNLSYGINSNFMNTKTGQNDTSIFYNSNNGGLRTFASGLAYFNYKMGFIIPLSHFKIIPFIETPILYIHQFSPFDISFFSRYPDLVRVHFPYLEMAIGCNIIF